MQYLQHLLDNSGTPFITAVILGLMSAISPCPLATNITAIGYISKDIENRRKIFLNGIIYTLGRALGYSSLGLALYFGASQFHTAKFFQLYGERILGPLLIVIGILLLNFFKINFPSFSGIADKLAVNTKKSNSLGVLLLGIVFAMAFCPYSGMLFFGMLIPLTISSSSGLYLPIIFAVVTGLPVVIIAWILAYSISGIGRFYNNLKVFEKWIRIAVAIIFICVGFYYIYIIFLK